MATDERDTKELRWVVVSSSDKIVHVVPMFGRPHSLQADCWCQPHWDTKAERLLIHECDN